MRIAYLRCFAAALAVVATVSTVPGLVAVADAQPSSPQRSRVVIQVSDADQAKWNLALNNAKNVQTDLGAANVDIEVVVYGAGGIGMLKFDSPVGNRVGEALASGVKVVACETTMRGQGLARADMLKDIGYVGSGVVEIMSKQQQGWAYIRP
jgi:intracellular sulfur oxidation DsrE/DsrF family protein